MASRIVCVVGRKNAGKTTLAVALAAEYARRRQRVMTIMHSDHRKFDAEDDRVMASLGKFASCAYQALVHIEDLKCQVSDRKKAEVEARARQAGLWTDTEPTPPWDWRRARRTGPH